MVLVDKQQQLRAELLDAVHAGQLQLAVLTEASDELETHVNSAAVSTS